MAFHLPITIWQCSGVLAAHQNVCSVFMSADNSLSQWPLFGRRIDCSDSSCIITVKLEILIVLHLEHGQVVFQQHQRTKIITGALDFYYLSLCETSLQIPIEPRCSQQLLLRHAWRSYPERRSVFLDSQIGLLEPPWCVIHYTARQK